MRWIFEPGHTAAEFTARHMMVCKVRGHFKNISGELQYDPENPAEASVRTTIDASTLWTGEKHRDDHLRHDDFLGVETYPEITFTSNEIKTLSENQFTVLGDLTIRDVTKEIPLDVMVLGRWATPYWEDGEDKGPIQRIGFEAETSINRHDFNVSWNSTLEGGGVVVGDEVAITIDVEALEADKLPT